MALVNLIGRSRSGPGWRVAAPFLMSTALVCSACSGTPTTIVTTQTPSSSNAPACTAETPTARPHPAPASLERVKAVVQTVTSYAWNPIAPQAHGSVPGGVYINWSASWDGVSSPPSNTNFQSSGVSDSDSGTSARHDPLADLLILHAVDGYLATGAHDAAAETLRCRLRPVVMSEFASYGVDRGWVYSMLADLARLDPAGPWLSEARTLASLLARIYVDPITAAVRDPRRGDYRSDWAAETAAALVQAGTTFNRPDWVSLGERAAARLVAAAPDPTTGLFPGALRPRSTYGPDQVEDALAKVGAQAQLLDSLLTVYDTSHDRALLTAVEKALTWLDSPRNGVFDAKQGSYFMGVNADGTSVRNGYEETRQAWMLPLFEHLRRATGGYTRQTSGMTTAVRDSFFRPFGQGYVYRLAPDMQTYTSLVQGVRVHEDWISAEATGIALNVLLGPLR